MASILDGLNIAKLSLSAQQYAMTVSQRNTANVNNPNYTRQDVFFTDLTVPANWSTAGVPGVELWAARNRYLDQSISYELPALGENLVKYNALKEIDAVLQGTSGGGLGTSIDKFFNSFTELSSSPTDSSLRWQVLSSAETMIEDFHRLYSEIQRVQNSAERHIVSGVEDINKLTAKIADLNGRIETAHTVGQMETEYALRDERQQYIEELQGKVNFLYFETEAGSITITTKQGDALVLGRTSMKLTLGDRTDGAGTVISHFSGIYLNDKEITDTINSGEIGGYIQVRDTLIPGYLKTLDDTAAGIIDRVNTVHAEGWDLDNNQGGDFFVPFTPAPPNTSAARTIKLAITDPREIAAAGDEGGATMGIGDNNNAKKLAEIGVEKFYAGGTQTVGEMYASLIYTVGADQRTAKESGEKQQSVLGQLLGQRDSESGVSLNEEAINLIKFQRAYQASSRIVAVLNALSAEVLNFVGV